MEEILELKEQISKAKKLPLMMKAGAIEKAVDSVVDLLEKQEKRLKALESKNGE